jgi:hypothetical protein
MLCLKYMPTLKVRRIPPYCPKCRVDMDGCTFSSTTKQNIKNKIPQQDIYILLAVGLAVTGGPSGRTCKNAP